MLNKLQPKLLPKLPYNINTQFAYSKIIGYVYYWILLHIMRVFINCLKTPPHGKPVEKNST